MVTFSAKGFINYTDISLRVRNLEFATYLIFTICGNTNKTRPTHRRTNANLYPPKKQLAKASEPSFDLEGGAHGQI